MTPLRRPESKSLPGHPRLRLLQGGMDRARPDHGPSRHVPDPRDRASPAPPLHHGSDQPSPASASFQKTTTRGGTVENAPTPTTPIRGLPAEVIRSAQAGDVDAFTMIVEEFQQLVHSTVYRLIAGRFRDQVEDVTQDIFLRLFRVLPRFDLDRGTRFSSWVLTLVKNHCFDVLKKRHLNTVSLTGNDQDDPLPDPPAMVPDPSKRVRAEEIQTLVAEAVDALPRAQRLVFVLREYEGLTYQEVADVVGCNEGTVKSRLHRAKEALRMRLSPILDPEPEDMPAGYRLKAPLESSPA